VSADVTAAITRAIAGVTTPATLPGSRPDGTASVERLLSAGRLSATMPWILGLMVFLATLASGAALSGARAAVSLRATLDGRLTVQVVEGDSVVRSSLAGRALARLQGDPAVADAALVPEAEVRSLIAPYVGAGELDADLPVPALIDVTLSRGGGAEVAARLARELEALSPAVRVDESADWAAPVRRFLTLAAALAGAVLVLSGAATTAAVVLAARAALDAHRATIATLHLLGATDRQVSRLFERRVVRDGRDGIGAGWLLAVVAFLMVAGWTRTLGIGIGSDGAGGGGDLNRWLVAAATVAVPLGAIALTRLSTRVTVRGALKRMR